MSPDRAKERLAAWVSGHVWGTVYAALHGERRTMSDLRVVTGRPRRSPYSARQIVGREVSDLLEVTARLRKRERWALLLVPWGSEAAFRFVRLSQFPRRLALSYEQG